MIRGKMLNILKKQDALSEVFMFLFLDARWLLFRSCIVYFRFLATLFLHNINLFDVFMHPLIYKQYCRLQSSIPHAACRIAWLFAHLPMLMPMLLFCLSTEFSLCTLYAIKKPLKLQHSRERCNPSPSRAHNAGTTTPLNRKSKS